ncbi:tryptophan synthase subunit alpha [Naumannella halotolerans]|uniref:Tryptophan synthase alpha chain n=1 Tax=Naumannella halotolerans TaxID=993414 RepID=A0A4R7J7W9_9ACTN|nr:tryptophan synthase subunit alpha [Naumannella halotolerans]TDT33561.1 tryptophan synthase alpha chain [Naumannella halotolerans]
MSIETGTAVTAAEFQPGHSGKVLQQAAAEGRKALVGFYHVGFPEVHASLDAISVIAGGGGEGPGVDIVEIGMPYSDPVMDGPTIQRAATTALANGVRTRDALVAAETVAQQGKSPLVMTYWNLIEQYGVEAFARDFANAGGHGLITPDLTPDEAQEWIAASEAHGLDRIFLVAPSSTDERISLTVRACRGWVYATSVMGVTGTRTSTSSLAPALVGRVRSLVPDALVGVGLGVSDGEQAAEVAGFADAVIVGSALVKTGLTEKSRPEQLADLAKLTAELAEGVRRG